ncbi:hypothetical protein, partial [Ancylomarina salipaludis]|uniref:hypothetical protein n=1 Tax=Ancylomarina salipaludis TaxID=2501299 RepID=UPI0019D70041
PEVKSRSDCHFGLLASGKSIAGTAVNQGAVFISDGMNIVLSFRKKPLIMCILERACVNQNAKIVKIIKP